MNGASAFVIIGIRRVAPIGGEFKRIWYCSANGCLNYASVDVGSLSKGAHQ